jgi:hypothetical protein
VLQEQETSWSSHRETVCKKLARKETEEEILVGKIWGGDENVIALASDLRFQF